MSSGNVDDEARSVYCHRGPKSLVTSGSSSHAELSDSKSVSALSRPEAGNETPRELVTAKESENFSVGHDEKRSQSGSVVSTPRFDDLSSLVYRGADEAGRSSTEKMGSFFDQPEEDEEEVEERVDSLMFDVMKDGKERFVMKLIHSEFRSGLPVKDFPAELPFRNVLALLLPENGLSDLTLFAEVLASIHLTDCSHYTRLLTSCYRDSCSAAFPSSSCLTCRRTNCPSYQMTD